MPTPHIEAEKTDIAPLVLMPGDPKRAEYIAKTFLKDVKLVNQVRGETAYTGTYKGNKITIFPSGMGIPSIGIYSYELFEEYDVDVIIRVGSAGAYSKKLKIYDVMLADSAFSETRFDEETTGESFDVVNTSPDANSIIISTAEEMGIDLHIGRVHTTDAFYRMKSDYLKFLEEKQCLCVDMETFALSLIARQFHKKATSLLTISDEVYSTTFLSPKDRETKFNTMCSLALESIIKIK